MTRLGVAVIGCGFQGAFHAQNVARSERADLVLCVDTDKERADRVATMAGAGRASDEPADVWDDPRVDVVVIATTTHTHHPLAMEAAHHGKHMLLEKPMAMTVEECLQIEEACRDAGIVAVLGYKFRFTKAVVAAHKAVPNPRVLLAHTLYDPAPEGANAWVNDRALSGGRLVSSLVHSVDLLRFLSGDEIARVYAEAAHLTGGISEPDTATVSLAFANGAIGSIVHGTAGASGLVSTWSFQAASLGANATIHDHGRRLTLHRAGEPDVLVVDETGDPFEAGTAPLFEALAAAIAGEGGDVPGPRDGTLSLLVSRCIEESMATGQPVAVPSI